MSVQEHLDRPKSRLRKILTIVVWAVVVFYFLFGALIITTRWYLLPQIGKYKDEIAASLAEQTQCTVSIGKIEPSWNGLWPRVLLTDVRFEKPAPSFAQKEILTLPHVEAVIAWRSVVGEISFRSLRIVGANLSVRRVLPSVFDFGGFTVDFAQKSKPAQSASGLKWLLAQEKIDIVDSKLNYIDLTQEHPKNLTASQLHATLERSHLSEIRFGLQAVMQGSADQSIDLRGRFKPAFLHAASDWQAWNGEGYADVRSVDLEDALEASPWPNFLKSGRGNIRIWSTFRNGKPVSTTADLSADDLKVQFGDLPEFVLPQISTRIAQSYDEQKLLIGLSNLRICNESGPISAPLALQAEFVPNAEHTDTVSARLSASEVPLAPLATIIASLPVPPEAADAVFRHHPTGTFSNTVLTWSGPWRNPSDWHLQSDFTHLSFGLDTAHEAPAVDALSGTFSFGPRSGTIRLDSKNTVVSLPNILVAETIPLQSLQGRIDWQLADGKLSELHLTNVSVINQDIDATVSGTWKNTEGAGFADLSGTIRKALPAQAWHYLPQFLPQQAIDWVAGGLRDGIAKNGRFVICGDLNHFPWHNEPEQGEFLVEADIENGVLAYVPSAKRDANGKPIPGEWPLLSAMQGHVIFHGSSLTGVVSSAQSAGANLSNGAVTIDNMGASTPLLTVSGQTQCDMGLMANYLRISPLKVWLPEILTKAKAQGTAQMQLALAIPLAGPEPITLQGKLSMENNTVELSSWVPPLRSVSGTVNFSEKSASAPTLQVQALGGQVVGNFSYTADKGFSLDASGEIEPSQLDWWANNKALRDLFGRITGKTPAKLALSWNEKKGFSLEAHSTLQGAAMHFPEPFRKTAQESWPLRFSISSNRTQPAADLYSLQMGNKLALVIQSSATNPAATLGAIAIGRNPALPKHGIALEIAASSVNYDEWKEVLLPVFSSEDVQPTAGAVQSLRVDIERLTSAETSGFTNVRAHGTLENDHWRLVTNADEFAGTVLYYPTRGPHGEVQAVFDLLHLPLPPHERINHVLEQSRRFHLPSLRATVKDFSLGEMNFGTFTIKADNTYDEHGQLWKIDALAIENPAGTVTATGQWWWHDNKDYTEIKGLASIKNAGDFLSRLGYRDVIRNANGTLQTYVNWQGAPWDPDTASLNGSMQIDLKQGSLRQVEPGAVGRLLSLISVQSLLRRMTLDFSDIFGQGLSFDTITWPMEVKNGIAKITNAKILGPHASMILEGTANLPEETIQGKVLVLPDVNAGGASLALAFVNPAVGIGTFLAQLLLRDPLSKLFAVEYAISGSIDKPEITKVAVPRRGTTSNADKR